MINEQKLEEIICEMLKISKKFAFNGDLNISEQIMRRAKETYITFNQLDIVFTSTVKYDLELTNAILLFQTELSNIHYLYLNKGELELDRSNLAYLNKEYQLNLTKNPKSSFEKDFVYTLSSGQKEVIGYIESIFYKKLPIGGKMNSKEDIIAKLKINGVFENLILEYEMFLDNFNLFTKYLTGDADMPIFFKQFRKK